MSDVIRVKLEDLGAALRALLEKTAEKNRELIAKKFMSAPERFIREAQRFYPSVLKRPTGRLIGSFGRGGIARDLGGGKFEVGLSSDVEYAAALHEGSKPHIIEPRFKKVLHWKTAGRLSFGVGRTGKFFSRTVGRQDVFTRRVHHPGTRATQFFSIPITTETETIMDELEKEIGWAE
jgi:hypothetical protein